MDAGAHGDVDDFSSACCVLCSSGASNTEMSKKSAQCWSDFVCAMPRGDKQYGQRLIPLLIFITSHALTSSGGGSEISPQPMDGQHQYTSRCRGKGASTKWQGQGIPHVTPQKVVLRCEEAAPAALQTSSLRLRHICTTQTNTKPSALATHERRAEGHQRETLRCSGR